MKRNINPIKFFYLLKGTDNKQLESLSAGNLGSFYTAIKKYSLAESYIQKSLDIANEIGSFNEIKYAHQFFYVLYEKSNRPAKALEHYKLYIIYKDSLFNEENARATYQQEMNLIMKKDRCRQRKSCGREKSGHCTT